MNVKVTPSPLRGKITAIPSKSDAHRLLICSALADAQTELSLPRTSEDIDATIGCLRSLGAKIERDGEILHITPITNPADSPLLDCAESGSTLRFLLPVAAALCESAGFIGSGRLPERPLGQLIGAMEEHEVTFSQEKLPFATSGKLLSGKYVLPGNISSQYITGLLLALPLLAKDSEISLTTRLESSAYVDITLNSLGCFGVNIERTKNGFFIKGNQRYRSPIRVDVDGDWSNAAFFLCAGAIGGNITLTGLNADSPQGDRRILEFLRKFGADITESKGAIAVKSLRLVGCEIDIAETPDLLPALAVVAAFSEGETRFINASRLRLKESDRLNSTAAMLNALGGNATELPDALIVRGTALAGGAVDSFHDHRTAMAAAIAGTYCKAPVIITDAGAAAKSYPSFYEDFAKLGGKVDVV